MKKMDYRIKSLEGDKEKLVVAKQRLENKLGITSFDSTGRRLEDEGDYT